MPRFRDLPIVQLDSRRLMAWAVTWPTISRLHDVHPADAWGYR